MNALLEDYPLSKNVRSRVRFFSIDKRTGMVRKLLERTNLVLFEGADVLAQLLSGARGFHVATMYLEFKNLALPADPITPPTFDRGGGIGYYNGLISSTDTDFLRVPLTVSPLVESSGGDYAGNQVTFFGISEGVAGFHGKPFLAGSNSAVFGAGLVASPDPSDQSLDRVYARAYTGIDKILKEAGFEIGVTWTTRFN
jgi:hypothetical protein